MGKYTGSSRTRRSDEDWQRREELGKLKYPFMSDSEREARMQIDEMDARLRRIEALLEKKHEPT